MIDTDELPPEIQDKIYRPKDDETYSVDWTPEETTVN